MKKILMVIVLVFVATQFTIAQTVGFIEREMLSSEGGFYSALDADSESVEGKFYVWSEDEIKMILGSDAGIFSDLFFGGVCAAGRSG